MVWFKIVNGFILMVFILVLVEDVFLEMLEFLRDEGFGAVLGEEL